MRVCRGCFRDCALVTGLQHQRPTSSARFQDPSKQHLLIRSCSIHVGTSNFLPLFAFLFLSSSTVSAMNRAQAQAAGDAPPHPLTCPPRHRFMTPKLKDGPVVNPTPMATSSSKVLADPTALTARISRCFAANRLLLPRHIARCITPFAMQVRAGWTGDLDRTKYVLLNYKDNLVCPMFASGTSTPSKKGGRGTALSVLKSPRMQ